MPYHFHRTNHRTGQVYSFVAVNTVADVNSETIISTGDKQIRVYHDINKLNQSYYDWQNKGESIQRAFPYLSPDEREFLMTGITADEWNLMFEEDEE